MIGGRQGTETGLDDQDTMLKRGGTTGDYTQEEMLIENDQEEIIGNADDD
jgi:hypothetical protein